MTSSAAESLPRGTAIAHPTTRSIEFNENDPKYRCCCGCCRVRTGAIIINIVEFIGVLFAMFATLAIMMTIDDNLRMARWGFAFIVNGAGTICLFITLVSKKENFFIGYFVTSLVRLLGVLIYTLYKIYEISQMTPYDIELEYMKYSHDETTQSVSMKYYQSIYKPVNIGWYGGWYILEVIFTTWFLWVIYKCFVYFRDLNRSFYQPNVVSYYE